MSTNQNITKRPPMWQRPWGVAEGMAVGVGLTIVGGILQVTVGPIDWTLMAQPVNLIAAAVLVLLIIGMHLLSRKVYMVQWLGSGKSAVASLIFATVITTVMGCIRQAPAGQHHTSPLGFDQMVTSWVFVLTYLWLTLSLGLAILRHGVRGNIRSISFQLNHIGLFVALIGATLGSADMQRLRLTSGLGQAEWRATDQEGKIHELPLAIELHEFTIDEYPPKLMLVDNKSGHALPDGKPQHILLEESTKSGVLGDWSIAVTERVPTAAAVATIDTVRYTDFKSMGASYAVHVSATNRSTNQTRQGWVSCGSFMFPYQPLRLDDHLSVVMPEREPKRFASQVTVYTERGERVDGIVEVNKPLEVNGWKIYQLSYDETKGRWSDISVFELVSDPWLPVVYIGIFMMMIGVLSMTLLAPRVKRESYDLD